MSKSRPRLNGIQSEPNSIDTSSPTSSLSSKLQQAVVISGSTLAGPAAAIKAHKFRQQETHSVEFPNVPPQRDSTRRLAVGNAILQTTGLATVSVDSVKHPMYFSSRPSTSASAISSSTIPISLRSISVIGKREEESSPVDKKEMTMVVEKSCHDQLPPASPLYEQSLSSSIESLEIRGKPKMSNESDESCAINSPSISSSSSTSGSGVIAAAVAAVSAATKPLPKNVAAIAARHKFEKAPTLTCSSSEDHPSDDIPRHASTSSLPAFPVPSQSLYEKTKLQLEEDEAVQREISLGKRIGFYRLGKELGAGNFSKVKLGVHCLTKEKVAVKIMDKSKMDQKAQRLLSREIASMELLHHPNVIRLFEVIETLSKVYLMMEYAAGGELYTYVHENGKLTEETAKPIFAQLVSAVAHLHAKGIVHRDIKAENVIFSQPGWIKLADFGFSCKYEDDTHLATFCGSPPYAAPELFRDPNYHGPAVDIWALGVTLYFMLVGVTPFRGETVQILKTNIMKGTYTVPEYVSGFAQYVIQRLLCMEPHKRSTILDIKKMYWLSQSKFPDSYLQISITPNESSLKTDQTEREVWGKLKEIGIDDEMIRSAAGKGAKDAIIGTYRIILYQCQAPEHEKERNKVRDHIHRIAERNKRAEEQFTNRSKTCTII